MNEENKNINLPEETSYTPTDSKNTNSLEGVTAPVLDDIDYYTPTPKKDGPKGVEAPVLDDMDAFVPNSSKKDGPQGVTAPILDDDNYVLNSNKTTQKQPAEALAQTDNTDSSDDISLIMNFTPQQKEAFDKLNPQQQQKVIELRQKQLAEQKAAANIKPPVLDDDNYVPPAKESVSPKQPDETIKAPILDTPVEQPKYVPKYADEDLEKAKAEGAKRSVASQLTSNQKDQKESLRMMQELRRQREDEAAAKGFKITVVIAIIGFITSVLFTMFASGNYFGLSYKADAANKFRQVIADSAMYISIISGVSALLLITGIKGLKSLASFVYFVFSFLMIFPGIVMITQKDGHMALNGILYGLCLIGSVSVFVTLCASESVSLFFKKNRN